MSGKPPFGGQSDVKALIAVSSGQMPDRKDHPQLPAEDPLWNLLEACWSLDPEARPTMAVVASKVSLLSKFARNADVLIMPPCLSRPVVCHFQLKDEM